MREPFNVIQIPTECWESGSRTASEPKHRVLVPVGDDFAADRLATWLAKSSYLNVRELQIVHIVEPSWWASVPYSGAEAMLQVERDVETFRAKRESLQGLTAALRKAFPDLEITANISIGNIDGRKVASLAAEWQADCILVFLRTKRFFLPIGGGRLLRQLLSATHCAVVAIPAM